MEVEERRATSERERAEHLDRCGHNVLYLDAAKLHVDFFTDVPPRAFFPEVAEGGGPAADPSELAERMYGPARYLLATKGRAAQIALAIAMGHDPHHGGGVLPASPTVVAPPLFMSSHHALGRIGARVEQAPTLPGSADLDVAWLEHRLDAMGTAAPVSAVFLESCNNALGGHPMRLSNLEAVARACRAREVPIVLDACRLLADCLAHGGSLFETARAYTSSCDAFVVSGTKELLAPYGAIIGVRDERTQRRAATHLFLEGSQLEPPAAVATLGRGMAHLLAHPEIIADRARQLRLFADALRAAGIEVLEPLGGHAIYLPLRAPGIDAATIDERRPETIALEAWIYRAAGMRVVLFPHPHIGPGVVRLALTVGRYSDDELRDAASTLAGALSRAGEAPRLCRPRAGKMDTPLADQFELADAPPRA